MDIYREVILDHYKHPRNFGHLDDPDVVVEEGNVTCGDRIVMEIKCTMHNKKQIIKDIRFSGEGCAISQASASMLTEVVVNTPIQKIMKMGAADITDLLGITLTPSRVKCAMLPLEVLHKAIVALK